MLDVPTWVWLFFVVAAVGELYFFLMQRSALEICRASRLDDEDRFYLLPASYRFMWWAIAAKWLGAILLAWYGSIPKAIAALAIGLVASTIVPVPHAHFIPKFEARLKAFEGAVQDEELDAEAELRVLRNALRHARQEL